MANSGSSMVNTVEPLNYPLSGSSLIEASAGTGKTWTIAALYLRLILGHGTKKAISPEQILVLTFTKAAARELKDRIRQKLSEAASFFIHGDSEDLFLQDLKNSINQKNHVAYAGLLNIAAQSMDMASISTIHAWCDKVLKQHAFDSGSLFDQELTQDTSSQSHYAVWDYWRLHIATLPADKYAEVISVWSGPESLKSLVKNISTDNLPDLESKDLGFLLDQLKEHRKNYVAELKDYWRTATPRLLDWLYSLGKNFKVTAHHKRWLGQIQAWVDDSETETLNINKGWYRLSPAGVLEDYTGDQLEIIPECKAIDQLQISLQKIPSIKDLLYKHAFVCLSENLQLNLLKDSQMDFDSLLIRMEQALTGRNGKVLAATLRKQYPIILVDEFQDTDPVQYSIFNNIYEVKKNNQDTAIIFIGDPKQSIYRFRGADIYTYIQAVQDCGTRIYTLNKNYRSAENMVFAVNELFSVATNTAFLTADKNHAIEFKPVQANGLQEQLFIDDEIAPAISACWLDNVEKPLGVTRYRSLAALACAGKIAEILNYSNKGRAYIKSADESKPVSPSDIVILVNQMSEAKLIQQALAKMNIRSVYLSERTSVYDSQQALELLFILMACLEPQNNRAVSAALACPALGISYSNLSVIKNNDSQWDIYVERFIKYSDIWHKNSVLPMFYRLLHDFAIPANLLADNYMGERALTNFLHLADLLQNASVNLDGPQALLHYLNRQIENRTQNDATLLRLESDESLVKITTIHKSKGLEYPVVFLPFIGSGIKNITRPDAVDLPLSVNLSGKQEWLFSIDQTMLQKYLDDSLGEEVRKLYVAVTRARHAVWMALKYDSTSRICGFSHILNNDTRSEFNKLCDTGPEKFCWVNFDSSVPAYQETGSGYHIKKSPRFLKYPALKENWWISSYSALHLGKVNVDTYLEYNLIEDQYADDTLDLDLTDTSQFSLVTTLADIPKGSSTGTFLHGLLQSAANGNFSKDQDIRDMIARRCAVRGWQEHIDYLYSWLSKFADNTWRIGLNNSQFQLVNLNYSLPELEFLLPVRSLDSQLIDKVITASFHPEHSRPELLPQQLNGMFKGYIDLCFQNTDGLYYVVDYKSNYLGEYLESYSNGNLIKTMLAMRYDVQMVLYALVLHMQLKMRLPDYDYDRDFGGAIYMFLRGQEASNQGLLAFRPDFETISRLENLFAAAGGK